MTGPRPVTDYLSGLCLLAFIAGMFVGVPLLVHLAQALVR